MPDPTDLRSPLAKARDEWLESPEGVKCRTGPAWGQYLENRLVLAFLAGVTAGSKRLQELEKRDAEKAANRIGEG